MNNHNPNHTLRYLGIVAVFCLVCVIYLGRLFFIQISGRENQYTADITEREVTVQAVRGEIYDRNGVKLVANRYSYDLSLAHAQFFSLAVHERNGVCLDVQTALAKRGGEGVRKQKYFPFDGTYPNYTYSAETLDGDSIRSYRLKRVLGDLGFKGDDVSAKQLRDYYTDTYDLLVLDSSGNRRYSDKEVDTIIRMYYDLDATRFRSSGEYVLCEDVDMSLMTYLKEQNIKALNFTVNVEREYCYPGYASHILGLVGPIYSNEWEYYNELGYQMNAIVGKSGCEAAFEDYLRGTDGKIKIKEDKKGNVVDVTVLSEAVAGNDVYLTIDINLQIAAEDGLKENVEYIVNQSTGVETGAECQTGAAVAMNPNTFEVLAIASYPTYDLTSYNADYNLLAQDPAQPLLNRAINGTFAPGSTLKPGMAAISLIDGVISRYSHVTCTGRYKGTVGCSTYGTNHVGSIDIIDAIAYSCNSFFCELGNLLGIEKMENYLRAFGLGQSTGLELGGSKGILAGPTYRGEIQSPELWQPGMTWQAAIGQSDHQLSPVQMACYIATLCNGGTRYTAHLLHSVYRFGSGEPSFVYQQTEDTVLSRIEISQGTLDTVFAGMKKVVSETASVRRWINSNTIPVTVGGKTGTAQTGGVCDNALFVAAAPYDNPDIVISVVLEKGYSGGLASLTAARILEAYYSEQ